MTRGDLFVGLDCGTTSSKAVVWSGRGKPVGEGRAGLRTMEPAPGFAEQSPAAWWRSACAAVARGLEGIDASRVAAVALSFQRESFVLLDEARRPVCSGILWYDARGAEFLGGLRRRLGVGRYHARTGKQLDSTSAVCKLAWLQEHATELVRRARYFADVPSYLAWRMTGRFCSVTAGADTTGLVSLKKEEWLGAHLEAAGCDHLDMPDLVRPGAEIGRVTPGAARAMGLPEGIPLVAGGGDGQCFALGAGLGDASAATLTLGTSAVLGVPADRPRTGDAFRTLLSCSPGSWLRESVIQSGSATVGWFHDRFMKGPRGRVGGGMEEWESLCAAVPRGCDGLMVLPYWRGRRVPSLDPRARGVALGWTDRHTAAHLRRAVMEGIAFEIADLLDATQEAGGRKPERLVVGGGGARSDTWCRILADATGRPCVRPDTVELASLGAAMLAMGHVRRCGVAEIVCRMPVGGSIFHPVPEGVALYRDLRDVFRRVYPATQAVVHALGARGAGGSEEP